MSSYIHSLDTVPTSTTHPTSDSFYAVWNDSDYRVTLQDMRRLVMPPVGFLAAVEDTSILSGSFISSYVAATVIGSDHFGLYDTNTPDSFFIKDMSIAAIKFTYNLWFTTAATVCELSMYKNGSLPTNAWERFTYLNGGEADDLVSLVSPYMSCTSGDYFQMRCTYGAAPINTANSLAYMSIELVTRR